MLVCDVCGSINFKTIDSRNDVAAGIYLKRRRECIDCGCRFTTVEINKEEYSMLVERAKVADAIANIAINAVR